MYKSPIEVIYGELQTQIEQEYEKTVVNAVREVGVNVDKDALIKALQYDRDQYKKGYKDGKSDLLDKIKAEIEKEPYVSKMEVLDFIDKYKAESEEV